MAAERSSIPGIDLTDEEYTVVQSLIRSKYRAEDQNGNVVLRGKKKRLKMKEEFPFTDGDGNTVFSIKAQGIMDVAGDYTLSDAEGNAVVVLDKNWTLLATTWKLRDPTDERLIATIESGWKKALITDNVPLGGLIPHSYDITDADGDHIGEIAGQFSLKDTYDVRVDRDADVPREAVVAAAMVIDAIEGN
jgi:uncharacterized protein YxjI